MKLENHLNKVIVAHRNNSLDPSMTTRKWDEKTPYSIHPIWCAMTLLTETTLPEKTRKSGFLALLYHDFLENTTTTLPSELSEGVKYLIREMTFEGGSPQEIKEIWKKGPEVKLLKLYDRVSNLLDGSWMDPERQQRHIGYVKRLVDDVETVYGKLNITKIARVIIE